MVKGKWNEKVKVNWLSLKLINLEIGVKHGGNILGEVYFYFDLK